MNVKPVELEGILGGRRFKRGREGWDDRVDLDGQEKEGSNG